MSIFEASMEPMLEMFIYESTTLLEQLDEILLESEKNDRLSEDNINEIFRIMHTIKGSSAMMGVEGISSLAHAVEDVFFIIREDPSKLERIHSTLFDLVFQASDFLKSEIDVVQDDDYVPKSPDAIISQLRELVATMKEQPAPAAPETAAAPQQAAAPAQAAAAAAPSPAAPVAAGPAPYRVRVFFDDGCQMENIRAFMLVSQLKDWCESLSTVPEHPENDASCCDEILKNGFLIEFVPSAAPEDVYKVIENAVNVKSYEVLENTHPASHAPEEHPAAPENAASNPAPAGQQRPSAPAAASSKAAPSQAGSGTNPSAAPKSNKQSLISVNQYKLDQLMDLVGEIVTTESMVSSNPDLKGLVLDNFHKSTRELRKLTDELQDVVMSIRMVPLNGVFQKMNRIVRDMSKKLNKEVNLETVGGDTEVDKTINDCITDPFMHMIRNSVDHGIESAEERIAAGKPEVGTVTISARNVGGEIIITIADDGRGLDRETILKKARNNGLLTKPESEYTDKEVYQIIMLPGFSTNEVVTEFSGRGVGMDVVRKNIETVNGVLEVDSVKNEGTTFTIKIPLTLAIVNGMEISVGDTVFILPISSITQSFKISDSNQIIHNTDDSEMIMLRGECYPILRLHQFFNIPTQITDLQEGILLQIENDNKMICLFADELLGEQQVVVKPFPVFLNRYNIKGNGLSGCTILGDGNISLILDTTSLIKLYER